MYIIINPANNALVMQLVCCSHFFFGIIIVWESCVSASILNRIAP